LRVNIEGRRTTASIMFSCRSRPVQLYAIVHGTKAQAFASIDGRSLRIVRGATMPGPFARVQWNYHEHRETRRELWGKVKAFRQARLHFFQGMQELIRRFYLAVEGRGEMPIPMAEALRTTRILDDILRSCAESSKGAV
jgi:hypothetical protein